MELDWLFALQFFISSQCNREHHFSAQQEEGFYKNLLNAKHTPGMQQVQQREDQTDLPSKQLTLSMDS
jgi:hypothetical protein